MRLLVLGGQGMLGHKLWEIAAAQGVEAWATVRRPAGPLMVPDRAVTLTDVTDPAALTAALAGVRPDVIVNCVGIVKQSSLAVDPVSSIAINALLPHQLAAWCRAAGARLIHVSTDCVFSGRRGHYTEADLTDAEDLYGRSKNLGEAGAPALTIRTSMIGRELSGRHGLVEWFLGESGPVRGYRRAIFSGLTTIELARVILDVIRLHPGLEGLYHVAADPIDKHALLEQIGAAFGHRAAIVPADEPVVDRSLDGRRFLTATGRRVPGWPEMIRDLAADRARYVEWRTM
jgi:dTDP-4-dehydrorhamnose reductase